MKATLTAQEDDAFFEEIGVVAQGGDWLDLVAANPKVAFVTKTDALSDEEFNLHYHAQCVRLWKNGFVALTKKLESQGINIKDYMSDLGKKGFAGLKKKLESLGITVSDHFRDLQKLGWATRVNNIAEKGISISQHFSEQARDNETWELMFGHLVAYKVANGDTLVPKQHVVDGVTLGVWTIKQRQEYKKHLSNDNVHPYIQERFKRLETIGFFWNANDAKWNHMYEHLKEYVKAKGNANVPNRYKDHENLGRWVNNQRGSFRNNKLSEKRVELLETIGIQWDMRK